MLQKSSKHFLISIFFPLEEGDTPSLSHPARYFGSQTMCTYFGVLQKSYKHFLISIFFPPGERGTPPPCPTRSVLRASNNEDLILQFCCFKCVLSIFICNIALQNTDFGVLQKSSKHFLISILFPLGEGDTPSLSHPPLLGTSGLEQWVHIFYDAVVKNVYC